jgi:hypothetical protein
MIVKAVGRKGRKRGYDYGYGVGCFDVPGKGGESNKLLEGDRCWLEVIIFLGALVCSL